MKNNEKTIDLLNNADLEQRISQIDTLPTIPEIYNQLVTELSSDDSSVMNVASIVSKDLSISVKVLQTVNSAYFGLTKKVQSIQQAVNYLGVETVKGIVLSAGVYSASECVEISGFSPLKLYNSGVTIGSKTRFIAQSLGLLRNEVDNAMTAGLLHDIGKLVLLVGFAKEFKEACTLSENENISLNLAEEKVFGSNDAAIGGYLLNSWGLCDSIVQAVSFHYEPSKIEQPTLDEIAAVHLAYASEQDQKHHSFDLQNTSFDIKYTDMLDLTNQLSQFKGISAEAIKYRD